MCSHIGFGGLGIANGAGAAMRTDPRSFADAVTELLSSEEKRRQMGTEGVHVIATKFDWDVVTLTLEGYFREVAGRTV